MPRGLFGQDLSTGCLESLSGVCKTGFFFNFLMKLLLVTQPRFLPQPVGDRFLLKKIDVLVCF